MYKASGLSCEMDEMRLNIFERYRHTSSNISIKTNKEVALREILKSEEEFIVYGTLLHNQTCFFFLFLFNKIPQNLINVPVSLRAIFETHLKLLAPFKNLHRGGVALPCQHATAECSLIYCRFKTL